MAILLDQATLGSNDAAAGAVSIALTTTATVAAGGTAFFLVTWDGSAGETLSSVDNGCQIVAQTAVGTDPKSALVRGYFAAGLASGSTVTATFSANTATNRAIAGCSFTGVANASATATDTAGGTANPWTTGSLSGVGLVISASTLWTRLFSNAPTVPSLEACDISVVNADKDLVIEYRIETSSGSYTNAGTWSTGGTQWNVASGVFAAAVAAGAAAPAAPRPRAFQEQGRIYSGEQTGFQPLAFQIPDPGRAFQEGTRFGEPRAFQDQAFQVPDPGVAFQPEAFDDSASFQMSVLAFQEPTGFQGDAFQEGLGLERRIPRTLVVTQNAGDENRDRFFRARQHRQARILRAPQPLPAAAPQFVKPTISVTEDRRAARIRSRRRKPVLLRAPLAALAPRKPVVETGTISRNRVAARLRRRRPQLLRAPATVQRPRAAIVHKANPASRRARLRRGKPILVRGLLTPLAPRRTLLELQNINRTRLVWRVRQRKAIILRGVSTPTPPPATGIPVKRIFVFQDRRAAFVKARRRSKQILRAPSVPTPVPWIRNHVYVSKRARNPIMVRERHKSRAFVTRSFVASVRPATAIIHKQRRRLQQKRRKTQILRSVPLWQRPHTPLIVGQHRKAGILARARRRLRLVVSHVYGPPPPAPTESAFGQVFLSDRALYELGLSDLELYAVALKDGELYAVSLGDLVGYDANLKDSAVYETSLSDIPGG